MPELTDKQIRVKGDTHLLVDKITNKLNKSKVYPTRVYTGGVVEIMAREYIANHPELGVRL